MGKECENSLQQKAKELVNLESRVLHLTNEISTRDLELQNNINQIACLKEQLSEAKEKLCANCANKCETVKLKNETKFNNISNSVTDTILPIVNQENINVYNYAGCHNIQPNDIGTVYSTTNKNEIKVNPSLLEIESNNTSLIKSGTASLEWQS